jgi:hypothetical protein
MADVSHASLTGAQLHEPKGAATASLGQVYIADGAGSGSWGDVGTASFTGMIADFSTPFAPSGWLECNGSVISSTTYSALYNVMTFSQSGSRTNGSPIITGLDPTLVSGLGNGYYIFGTGINAGTTIISVDSATQLTMSANATSTGTGTVIVSPWLLGSGTIKLPDTRTGALYRRSRGINFNIGSSLSSQNLAHTHTLSVSGTTSSNGNHTHTATVTDPGHIHAGIPFPTGTGGAAGNNTVSGTQNTASAVTGITVSNSTTGAHTHTVTSTGTSGSQGTTEARPATLVVITCVKT